MRLRIIAVIPLFALLLAVACGRNPDAARRWHLARGNAYFARQMYAEAIVEYRNAVQQDPRSGEAHLRLGEACGRTRDYGSALRELVRAADLLPDRLDVQVAAGRYLLLAGRFADARARADRVLERRPADADALIIRGNALAGMRDLDAAIGEMERAVRLDPSDSRLHETLGGFRLARGQRDLAEASFKRAVEADPKSVAASLAMANFCWLSNRPTDAERWLANALRLDRQDARANRAMGLLCLATGRSAEAGKYLEEAARASADPAVKLTLADYYARVGHGDRALPLLASVRSDGRLDARGGLWLAAIYYDLGRRADAYSVVDQMIAHGVDTAETLVVKAGFLLGEKRTGEAFQVAGKAVAVAPRSASARLMLGRTAAAAGRQDEAIRAFNDALAIEPRNAAAQVQLGTLALSLDRPMAARQAFERATAVDPSSFEAANGLITLDLREKRPNDARRRADLLVARSPREVRALVLQARTRASTGDLAGSEAPLRRALEIDASHVSAYETLARVYLAQGRLDAAREQFEQVARREAKPVVAETMIGVILQAQKRLREARQHFERALALDPHAAVAANNLAWLYADEGGNLDRALALAQSAREQLPDRPEVNDTLGWIYYRKGLVNLAIGPLEESVERQPDNASYRYHLALAYLRTDQKGKARRALEEALRLNRNFAGADDARRLLKAVNQ